MVWAVANSNLALVKYWGKADEGAKHPAGASLSVTLASPCTAASVEMSPRWSDDVVEGVPDGAAARIRLFFDRLRTEFGLASHARVWLGPHFTSPRRLV